MEDPFTCLLRYFDLNRMLEGVPATFQLLIEWTLGDMNPIKLLMYLDKIIIIRKMLEKHEEQLEKMLKVTL